MAKKLHFLVKNRKLWQKKVKMKISTKGRYAVRIMADIAKGKGEFISLSDISQRQNITIKYAERIIAMFVKGGLVCSQRGVTGGYKLAKEEGKISVLEILNITGDGIKIASCTVNKNCERMESCEAMSVWVKLDDMIKDYLNKVTLLDLINR